MLVVSLEKTAIPTGFSIIMIRVPSLRDRVGRSICFHCFPSVDISSGETRKRSIFVTSITGHFRMVQGIVVVHKAGLL